MLQKYILICISIFYSISIFSAPEKNKPSALQSCILGFRKVSNYRKTVLDLFKASLVKEHIKGGFERSFNVEDRWKEFIAKKIVDAEQALIKKYELEPSNQELKKAVDFDLKVTDIVNWDMGRKKLLTVTEEEYISLVKKCMMELDTKIPVNVFWHQEASSSYADGYESISLSKEDSAEGLLKEFTIKHELSHLIHRHVYWRQIYGALLLEKQSKHKNDSYETLATKSEYVTRRQLQKYPEFLELMRLQEMQADIDASTTSLNSALEGAQRYLEICRNYENPKFDPHPSHCQRAKYLEEIYKQMSAKKTVKKIFFENGLLEASRSQQN
jgi:hypothetical protein